MFRITYNNRLKSYDANFLYSLKTGKNDLSNNMSYLVWDIEKLFKVDIKSKPHYHLTSSVLLSKLRRFVYHCGRRVL